MIGSGYAVPGTQCKPSPIVDSVPRTRYCGLRTSSPAGRYNRQHGRKHVRQAVSRHHGRRQPRARLSLHHRRLPGRTGAVGRGSAARSARRRPGQSKLTTQRDEADLPGDLVRRLRGQDRRHARSAFCSATPTSAAPTTATSRTSTAPATPTTRSTRSTAFATIAAAGGRAPARRSAASPPARSRRSCSPREGDSRPRLRHAGRRREGGRSPTRPRSRSSRSRRRRCAARMPEAAAAMIELIDAVRKDRDSIGGVCELVAVGVPPGLGEPVFDKLKADLGKALLSLPAVTRLRVRGRVRRGDGAGQREQRPVRAAAAGHPHRDQSPRRDARRHLLRRCRSSAAWRSSRRAAIPQPQQTVTPRRRADRDSGEGSPRSVPVAAIRSDGRGDGGAGARRPLAALAPRPPRFDVALPARHDRCNRSDPPGVGPASPFTTHAERHHASDHEVPRRGGGRAVRAVGDGPGPTGREAGRPEAGRHVHDRLRGGGR